jgi:hypothetical protein
MEVVSAMPKKRGSYSDWTKFVRITIQERKAGMSKPTLFWYEQFSNSRTGVEPTQDKRPTKLLYVVVLEKVINGFRVVSETGDRSQVVRYQEQRKEREVRPRI